MDSLKPISGDFFTRKKALVSYILSVFVFWVHISSLDQYADLPGWVGRVQDILTTVLPAASVPMFFILSGALFFRNYAPGSYLRKLKSRAVSLAVPYFGWNLIALLFQIVTTVFLARYFTGRVPFDFAPRSFAEGLFHWKYNNPMWYVMTLMLFVIAAPVLDLLLRNKVTAAVSILTLWVLAQFDIGLPEALFTNRTSIIFYLIGGMLGRFHWNTFSGDSGGKFALPSALGIAGSMVYLYAATRGWFVNTAMPNVAVLTVFALSMWIFADSLCRIVTARGFMERSFWVYAAHMNISAVFAKLLYLLLPEHWGAALPNFALTTVLTLVTIEIGYQIVRRLCPPLCRALSGAR